MPANSGQSLAARTADAILAMIAAERRFAPGDKLPNELALSDELGVSRTTLREAIRMLAARHVLEVRRGRGTFVAERAEHEAPIALDELAADRPDLKALYEIRLITEPDLCALAARRATDAELERILRLGREEEALIAAGEDRTEAERAFHDAITRAAHNSFAEQLMPVIQEGIASGVRLSKARREIVEDTLSDHRMIMDFLAGRDAQGAKTAMRLHILRAMRGFGIGGEDD